MARGAMMRAVGAAGVLALGAACGCGRAAGVILQPAPGSPAWPVPPDEPRVRYLGAIASDRDLKPGRRFGAGLGEVLFGKEAPKTMVCPMAVCTDGGSRVFVADSSERVVHVFDLATRRYERWAPAKGRPALVMPVGVAWDPAGRLLVSDAQRGVVCTFDTRGRATGELGAGELQRPCGVAADAARGRLFVADPPAHQVIVLSNEGREVTRLGGRGSEPGRFNFPTNVALDAAGNLYVSDTLNSRVQVFSPELVFLRQIGRRGDMPGYFSQPKGVATDAAGRVFVVDSNFEAVQVFGVEGALLMSFGREGRGAGEFWLPAGACIDASGRLWVADSYNKRVQVFGVIGEGGAR